MAIEETKLNSMEKKKKLIQEKQERRKKRTKNRMGKKIKECQDVG